MEHNDEDSDSTDWDGSSQEDDEEEGEETNEKVNKNFKKHVFGQLFIQVKRCFLNTGILFLNSPTFLETRSPFLEFEPCSSSL